MLVPLTSVVPAGQSVHTVAPCAERVPLGHLTQMVLGLLSLSKNPMAHGVQLPCVPTGAYVPGAHCVQFVAALESWSDVPAGQL